MLLGSPSDSNIRVSVEVVRGCTISTVAVSPTAGPVLAVSCVAGSEAVPEILSSTAAPGDGGIETVREDAGGTRLSVSQGSSLTQTVAMSSAAGGAAVPHPGGAAQVVTINF
jgi:hypothetical protein